MKRITIAQVEKAHEYMEQWIDEEQWQELAVFLDEGDTELAADYLVSAGAIDSDNCYEHAKPIEQVIERLAKDFRKLSAKKQQKRIDAALQNTFVSSCNDCNHVSFVPDGNEELYPELKTQCWECGSKDVETYFWNRGAQ